MATAPMTPSDERFRSARAVDHGCIDAIRACAAMMDAAESIGAYPKLCDVREAIMRPASGCLKSSQRGERYPSKLMGNASAGRAGTGDEVRAELLCYLVALQLLAHARTGRWLRSDHLVESIRIWLIARREFCSVFERIRLGHLSEKVAKDLIATPGLKDIRILSGMFTHNWKLDMQSPIVESLHSICTLRLITHDVRRPSVQKRLKQLDRYLGVLPTRYSQGIAIEEAVRAARRSQGKKNPEDVPPGSPDWDAVMDDFLIELYLAKTGRRPGTL